MKEAATDAGRLFYVEHYHHHLSQAKVIAD